MSLIENLRRRIEANEFEFSEHAVDQSILRGISVGEVREAVLAGQIIEDYPEDKYGPSCLVYGRTSLGRPIHIQCSHASRALVKIITVYQPDPERWIDFIVRRPE